METIPQLNTWQGLFSLVVLLITLYWLLKLFTYILEQFANRNITNKRTLVTLKEGLLIYKPIALILIALDFISINYITHSILLTLVGVFGYAQIKNYITGIFLKTNPLLSNRAMIHCADYTGEIIKFLAFGLIISTEKGERFIDYNTINNNGFAIASDNTSLLRQTLYLESEMPKNQILDLLFDNPILTYKEYPVLRETETKLLKLQYTLETGVSSSTLIAFLEDKKIKITSTNTILN